MAITDNGINLPDEGDGKTDTELVALTLDNQANFLYLIKRYKGKLFYYIRRISNVSAEEAEDILQEVFMKVYINLNEYDQDLKFSSWIYRIAHNQVISNHRKIQARPQTANIDLYDDRVISIASESDLNHEVDQAFTRVQIEKALKRIDIKYKEVLVLKYLEDKDYKEIADIIKKPIGTVASRMNKAKEELRNELDNIKL